MNRLGYDGGSSSVEPFHMAIILATRLAPQLSKELCNDRAAVRLLMTAADGRESGAARAIWNWFAELRASRGSDGTGSHNLVSRRSGLNLQRRKARGTGGVSAGEVFGTAQTGRKSKLVRNNDSGSGGSDTYEFAKCKVESATGWDER